MNGPFARCSLAFKLDSTIMVTKVVMIGPPSLCRILRVVVAIGNSTLGTADYAANTEGMLTAPNPFAPHKAPGFQMVSVQESRVVPRSGNKSFGASSPFRSSNCSSMFVTLRSEEMNYESSCRPPIWRS